MSNTRNPGINKSEEELCTLVQMCNCAGDNYYFEMDEATFRSSLKGHEDEPYYAFYCEQRALGMDAFKDKASQALATCSTQDLHNIVAMHNYDNADWLLAQIVTHPACDFASALQIYWASQPDFVYSRYSSMLAASQDSGFLARDSAAVMHLIEQRSTQGSYLRDLPLPDLQDLLCDKPDYSRPPFSLIPAALRIMA